MKKSLITHHLSLLLSETYQTNSGTGRRKWKIRKITFYISLTIKLHARSVRFARKKDPAEGFVLLLIGFITFGFGCFCFGYELPLSISINNEDDIHQLIEDDMVTEEIGQILLELYENPIDLNRASEDELALLPYISHEDASAIIAQREKLNGFKRWIHLALIKEISPIELKLIRSFAYIRPTRDWLNGWIRFNLSEVENDGKSAYGRLYAKTQLKNLIFGVAARHEDDKQYRWKEGVETVSPWNLEKFFLAWQGEGFFKEIVLGNYSARFGSGLVFNDAHRRARSGRLYPDYSTSTYRQRGIGISMKSECKLGSLHYLICPTVFTSFSEYPVSLPKEITGLERERKIGDVYFERLFGADLTFKLNPYSAIGLTWYRSWIEKHLDFVFDDFPNRESLSCFGFHFNTRIKQLDFYGEIARNVNDANAVYLAISNMTKKTYWELAYRNYDTDFENPHSYGYADADSDSLDPYGDIDEVGSYLLLRYAPHPRLTLKLSYDGWRHPSSHITENEIRGAFEYKLVDVVEIGSSTKWYNEELTEYDESKRATVTWLKIQPTPDWRLTTVYRLSRKKEENVDYDDYAYLKVEWQAKGNLELEGRWKNYDTLLVDGDTYPKQVYIQMQFWRTPPTEVRVWSGRIRFTHTRYGESSSAAVNHRNQVYFTARWSW